MSRVLAEKYVLKQVLGRGGMGEVYEATDTTTGREVAVKVMRRMDAAEATEGSEETEREWEVRFEREVQANRGLRSPHVVEVLDSGIDEASNERFLVMERLRGQDLSALLKKLGPLPPGLVLRLVAQALLGLERAHASGVVHRDIKPGNLFLANEGGRHVVRILDFGIARLGGGDEAKDLTELTRTGSMLGSPGYMAPEQVRGAKLVDARSDLWSIGVVMYRLLSGRAPHESADGLGGLLVAICTMPPAPLQQRAPWVPADVARIVHRALQMDREARYASARAMFDDVVALLPAGAQAVAIDDAMLVPLTSAERAAAAEPLLAPSDSHAVVAQTLVMSPPPRPRSRAAWAFALLGVAAASSVAVALRVGTAPPPPPAATAPPPPPAVAVAPPPVSTDVTGTVRVPPGETVEVDLVPTTPVDGAVVLRGTPGSSHVVKVGAAHHSVVLTANGAFPAAIEAPAPSSKPRPAAPAPRPSRGAAPALSASDGMRTQFE